MYIHSVLQLVFQNYNLFHFFRPQLLIHSTKILKMDKHDPGHFFHFPLLIFFYHGCHPCHIFLTSQFSHCPIPPPPLPPPLFLLSHCPGPLLCGRFHYLLNQQRPTKTGKKTKGQDKPDQVKCRKIKFC